MKVSRFSKTVRVNPRIKGRPCASSSPVSKSRNLRINLQCNRRHPCKRRLLLRFNRVGQRPFLKRLQQNPLRFRSRKTPPSKRLQNNRSSKVANCHLQIQSVRASLPPRRHLRPLGLHNRPVTITRMHLGAHAPSCKKDRAQAWSVCSSTSAAWTTRARETSQVWFTTPQTSRRGALAPSTCMRSAATSRSQKIMWKRS